MATKNKRRWVLLPAHRQNNRARVRVERAQRESLARNDLRSWRRATAVLECIDGATRAASAKRLGVDPSTVSRWIGAYLERGVQALRPGTAPGGKSRMSQEQLGELAKLIESGPQQCGFVSGVWTARMVWQLIEERYGVRYHWKYVPELLHKLGFSVQRPRKLLSRADHEAQERWLRETFPAIKKKPSSAAVSCSSKTRRASNSTPPCTGRGIE